MGQLEYIYITITSITQATIRVPQIIQYSDFAVNYLSETHTYNISYNNYIILIECFLNYSDVFGPSTNMAPNSDENGRLAPLSKTSKSVWSDDTLSKVIK